MDGTARAQEATGSGEPFEGARDERATARARPSAQQLFAAVVDLVSSAQSSAAFKRTARRYSLCPEDAEDAYQRALEILITKAPTDDPEQLRPWLQTVIKHEALAVRRQRERLLPAGDDPVAELAETARGPDEAAAERERASRTAQALGGLKQSEVQCMLLKALGYSYHEIAQRTGFSWTKVNRSLTEGRRHFLDRFDQIESGRHCRRFEPLLSAASDGEATREQTRLLEQHLRACQPCRALLRGYRAAPARVAEIIPPALVLPALQKAGWWSRVHDGIAHAIGERAAALGFKVQQAGEMVSAQKAAAVVASTAAVAGGGAAIEERVVEPQHRPASTEVVERSPTTPPVQPVQPGPATVTPAAQRTEAQAESPQPPAGGEFGPEASARARARPTAAAADPSAAGEGVGGAAGAEGGGFETAGNPPAEPGGGEFGP